MSTLYEQKVLCRDAQNNFQLIVQSTSTIDSSCDNTEFSMSYFLPWLLEGYMETIEVITGVGPENMGFFVYFPVKITYLVFIAT